MPKPIVKLNLHLDLPAIILNLTPIQHSVLSLALSHLLATIDSKDYEHLEDATVNAFGKLRTTIFGIQSTMRPANQDDATTFTT